MTSNSPHYLLFSEASQDQCSLPTWRFVLQNVESQRRFTATDSEPCDCSQRLELLAVVRGLEALDGPSRVTLVTKSRYVSRGIKKGLPEWRNNNWRWERFGSMVLVRDHDLWQRVDRALQFHQVNCQAWHFETVETDAATEAELDTTPLVSTTANTAATVAAVNTAATVAVSESVDVAVTVTSAAPGEIPVISRRTRRRVDGPHVFNANRSVVGPRIVHPVQRLKRRAQSKAADITAAIRSVTRPMCDAVGAAT